MPKISDNNLVEKSKSLVWAKFRDYTAGELRLLEVYLSRINPRDPSSSRVEFTLAEYRELLGLKSLDARRIEPQIKHFRFLLTRRKEHLKVLSYSQGQSWTMYQKQGLTS